VNHRNDAKHVNNMTDARLDQWLTQADEAFPAPPLPADFAEASSPPGATGRLWKPPVAAAAVILALIGGWVWMSHVQSSRGIIAKNREEQINRLRAEVVSLERDADQHAKLAAELLAIQHQSATSYKGACVTEPAGRAGANSRRAKPSGAHPGPRGGPAPGRAGRHVSRRPRRFGGFVDPSRKLNGGRRPRKTRRPARPGRRSASWTRMSAARFCSPAICSSTSGRLSDACTLVRCRDWC